MLRHACIMVCALGLSATTARPCIAAAAVVPVVPGVERLGADDGVMRGSILLGELDCASCHDPGDRTTTIDTKPAPDLTRVAERANPGWIERFIADPHAVKPGTTMPHVLGSLDAGERAKAAAAITRFLMSLTDKPFKPATADTDAEAIQRGHELFSSIGCVACHNPRAADATEQPIDGSIPLGALGDKYSVATLAAFLEDPLAVRPGGRMPGLNLTHWEAHDVAAYLTQKAPAYATPPTADAATIAEGRRQFASLGCAACHTIDGVANQRKAPAMADLRPDAGCLSPVVGASPRFGLSDAQRKAVAEALRSKPAELSAERRITKAMATFNCVACHRRGSLGGVAENRLSHFHTDNENLGEQGRIPPPLTGVGAKLQPDWLRRVMVYGESVRPYVRTRMPAFGKANAEPLVALFAEADADLPAPPPLIEHANRKAENEYKGVGRELVGSGGFNCVACHTFKGEKPPTMSAIDLADTTARLKRSWLNAYLLSPQRFSPSTLMPSFWPEGKSTRANVLDGDTARQLDAIWQYLSDGNEAGTPRGLVSEPLILTVGDEAVMLRRQYPGVGKRGIGVGYPGRVNLVFDAEQMRLTEIWKGDFADAGGVWRGQGAGNVRLLGDDHVKLPEGAVFAELADVAAAWPDKTARDAGIRFKGYTLDKLRRPTFEYRIGDIAVTDEFIDQTGGNGKPYFHRTLTFDSPREAKLVMRLASDAQIERGEFGGWRIGKSLLLVIGGGDTELANTVEVDKIKELRAPIHLSRGKTKVVIEYRW